MTKDYYNRYWKHTLPKMKFFDNEPNWSVKLLERYYSMMARWLDWKNPTIIDFGCGRGDVVDYLQKRGWSITGVDISDVVIEQAKKKHYSCHFKIVGDKIQVVATILSFDVMEHIFDFDEYFKFVKEHLALGGRMIVSTNEMGLLKFLAIGLFFKDTFHHPYSPHIRFFTKKTLSDLFEYHGFKVIHQKSIGNHFGLPSGQFCVAERIK